MSTGASDPHKTPDSQPPRGGGVREWFRHAFAVEGNKPLEPTAEEAEVVDRLLLAVVRRRMTVPAVLMLESSRPMNYVGAQALHFFAPFAEILVSADRYRTFTALLERRGSIDYLLRRLGEIEEEEKQKQKVVRTHGSEGRTGEAFSQPHRRAEAEDKETKAHEDRSGQD